METTIMGYIGTTVGSMPSFLANQGKLEAHEACFIYVRFVYITRPGRSRGVRLPQPPKNTGPYC